MLALPDRRVPERLRHASIYANQTPRDNSRHLLLVPAYCHQTNLDRRVMRELRRLFNLPVRRDEDRQFIGKQEDCEEATRTGESDVKTASFKRGNMSHSKTVVGENEFQWRVWEDAG
jgi:hypothetical protein